MNEVLYAQLVSLLDVYERDKKDSQGYEYYVYNSGACDALRKLKSKIESYEEERINRESPAIESGADC